jgi:outer membrane protein OmpA-like peptidoglycan-associated protein
VRLLATLLLTLTVAPVAAQVAVTEQGPDSPAVEQAARQALPGAQVRRIVPEVRRIEGLASGVGGSARTLSGEVTTMEGVARSLQAGGLQTRMVNGGLEVSLPGDVLFDFDRASIRTTAIPTLEKVASAARSTGERTIRVEGHTDAVGTPAYNQKLSLARADAVAGWLRSAKIAANRITTAGFGATRPVAPNMTAAGQDDPAARQRNRRVTVTFGA